jgi:hypothetical protein
MDYAYFPFIGFTLQVVGKILIAYTAIMVHHRVWQEHRIDNKVFSEMQKEKALAFVGILFIIVGYFLEAPSKLPS